MRTAIGFFGLVLLLAAAVSAQVFIGGREAQLRAAEAMGGVAIHDWPDAPKRFSDAQRMADAREWRKSAELYQEILEKFGDRLLPAEQKQAGVQRYTNVAATVQEKLAQWPTDGLNAYRTRYEPRASSMLDSAGDDPISLYRVYSQFLISDSGKNAGIRLIDLYLEDGQFPAAAWLGEQLLRLHPNLLVERPAVMFRTAVAFHFCGQDDKARALLDDLKKNFPDATGRVRGKDVLLAAALEAELTAKVQEPQSSPPDSWPMFDGSVDRSRVSTAGGRPGARLYSVELLKPNFKPLNPQRRREFELQDERDRNDGLTTGIIPVVDHGELFFQDGSHVYAVSLESGVPLPGWASTYPGERRGIYTLGTPWGFPRNKQLTLTVTPDAVLAVMGQNDTLAVQSELNLQTETRVVCLDRQNGRERWTISPRQLPDDAAALRSLNFSGSPLVAGSSVYVIAGGGRGPQFDDCYVVCFDLAGGQYRWSCYIASSTSAQNIIVDRTGMSDQSTHLAYAGGRLYVATNLGAVAAVDALGGKVLWLATYPRDLSNDPSGGMVNFRGRFDNTGALRAIITKPWTYNAAVFKDGRLFALPSDAKHLLVYDAADGHELKRISLEHLYDADTLVGVVGPQIVVTGKRSMGDGKFTGTITCIDWQRYDAETFDSDDSAIAWASPSMPAAIIGRSFITSDSMFVPTQERLLRLDTRKGKIAETYPAYPRRWETGEGPGNVIVAPEHVVVAGSQRVTVYTDMTVALAKLDREIAAAPNDAQPRLRYAELLFVGGQTDGAIRKLDEAIERLGGIKSMRPGAQRDRVYNDAFTFAQKLSLDNNTESTDAIYQLYDRAAAAAGTASQQVAWRVARAKFAHDQQNFMAEVDLYQQMLSDPALRSVSLIDDVTDGPAQAGAIAYRSIAEVIDTQGPRWYAAFEQAAQQDFEAARSAGDAGKLLAIAQQYPNASVAARSMLAAAEFYESRGELSQSAQVLRQIYFRYPEMERAKVLESLSRIYLAMPGRLDAAVARLSQGAKQLPAVKLEKPLKLPDGRTLENASFTEALVAVQTYRGGEATAALPDFHLPPPPTAADRKAGRGKPFAGEPSPVIENVAALLTPRRDFSRNDRVIAWSPAGGLSAYAIGAAEPVATNSQIDNQPSKIAWINSAGRNTNGSQLLVWNLTRLSLLAGDSLATGWSFDLADVPQIDVLASSPGDQAETRQAAGPVNRGRINVRVARGQVMQMPAVAVAAVPAANGPEAILDVQPLGDRVVISTSHGRVISVDAAAGKIAWQIRPTDRPIDRFVATEDFTVIKLMDPFNAQLIAMDSSSGQVIGRKLFPVESNLVPINFALSADGRLVYTLYDRLCIKDLYEPWANPAIEDPANGGQNAYYSGADKPDQLLISEGRILALSENGQFVRMHSLETGRLLRYFSKQANRELEGLLQTGSNQWNVSMRLVGPHLYLYSPRSMMAYNMDQIQQSWRAGLSQQTTPNIRDAYIGKDYFVLLDEPGSAGNDNPQRTAPLYRLYAFSLEILPNGNQSGRFVYNTDISDPAGIVEFQAVEGGFYYLAADQKLHFLRGARE